MRLREIIEIDYDLRTINSDAGNSLFLECQEKLKSEVEEGWKETLATAAIATAVGAGGVGLSDFKNSLGDKSFTTQAKPQIKSVTNQSFKDFAAEKKEPNVQPITNAQEEKILYNVATQSGLRGHELAQFMAQCAHETMNFKFMVERGDKSDFKKYEPLFKLNKKIKKVVNVNPKADVLGNLKRGDGERYKGRGFIQLTGRDNYERAGRDLGINLVQNPELAAKPEIAARIALWYWAKRVKTKVNDFTDTQSVTKQINPALKGIKDRIENYSEYLGQS